MYRGKFVFSISKGNIRQSLSTNDMIWIKSCLDNHYSIPPYRYANLIIKNSELEEIKDIINSRELILLQFHSWKVSENSRDTISQNTLSKRNHLHRQHTPIFPHRNAVLLLTKRRLRKFFRRFRKLERRLGNGLFDWDLGEWGYS